MSLKSDQKGIAAGESCLGLDLSAAKERDIGGVVFATFTVQVGTAVGQRGWRWRCTQWWGRWAISYVISHTGTGMDVVSIIGWGMSVALGPVAAPRRVLRGVRAEHAEHTTGAAVSVAWSVTSV
jgi:hypothetical protein